MNLVPVHFSNLMCYDSSLPCKSLSGLKAFAIVKLQLQFSLSEMFLLQVFA